MNAKDVSIMLRKGHPFIYQQASLEPRYIGASVYRKCSPEEIDTYYKFRHAMETIHQLTYTPNERDVAELVDSLKLLLQNGDEEYSDKKAHLIFEKVWEFVKDLNVNELEDICRQHDDLIEAMDYMEGAFYRHAKTTKR